MSDAIDILEKAATLAPERRDVQLALGKALARADRKEAAEAALRRAVEIDPKSAESRRALGGLLLEMPGRMRDGLAELEEYRRLKAEKGE